ncbi:hypothetical protein U9M48_003934 [Paspalum notatum var. saurae]|uniref:Uncharacterized protein n=1 Tax=Paspalum notatum var. saurae TaxID=547442 RepID=A0AAQ3SKB8_PASNO
MLGALCRYYYPGMVEVDGERQAAEQWSHWRLKEYVRPDEGSSAGGSSVGVVVKGAAVKLKGEHLRYRLENEDDMEVLWSVRRHFCRAAEKVIDDAFYNARISAMCQYYKRIKGENMSKEKGASQIYLTEQQDLQVSVDWIMKDVEAWRWLAKKWSTPEWIASSKSHRENRGKAGPGHRFGADGHYSLARRMEHESRVPPSFMYVFVRGYRGPDPMNLEVLCTEAAREKMMAYGEEMTQRHGPDFDWRQAEVCFWHQGCRLRLEYISSKEIVFVVWEFSLLKDSLRYLGIGGGSCSTRGGSSGNTNDRAADKHDSLHGFLPLGYHSSIGTRRELATLLPSSNVSTVGVDSVGATTPGLATTSGVDDGTTGLPATSRGSVPSPGWMASQGSQLASGWMAPQGSQPPPSWMAPQGSQPPLGWMTPQGSQPSSGWMPAAAPHFNPWMQSPLQQYGSQGSASRPRGSTPDAEGHDDLAGSGGASGHNYQSPQE